jgi:hypothetical protein
MTQITETSTLIPAQVGVGKTDFGLLSAGNLRRASRDLPYSVQWDDVQYLVGPRVEQYANTSERMDFLRLADGPEARALTYATLANLMPDGKPLLANLIMGLPVEVMMERALATQVLRDIRSWLSGTNRFIMDGQEYQVTIEGIQVVAQPAGAFFAWGMNNEGVWARAADDLNVLVGVCDLGFNTNDVFSVSGGQIVGKHTGGITDGIRRAAETLTRLVKDKYDVTLSRQMADRFLRAEKPILSCAAGDVNLQPLVSQALDAASATIGDFLETLLGNGKQFRHLLFTGGGAEMFRTNLLRRYPHGQILPNAVMANALGLARYGRRVFKSAHTVIGLDPGFGGFKAVCLKSR